MDKRRFRAKVRQVERRRRLIDRIIREHYIPWVADQLFAERPWMRVVRMSREAAQAKYGGS